MTDFVPLPADLVVLAVREGHRSNPDAIVAVVRSAAAIDPPPCAHCAARIVRNGMRAADFRDEPLGGRPVILNWQRQSRLCRRCGRSELEEHPFFDPQRSITRRLRTWLVEHARNTPLTKLSQRCGLDERSARRILSEADTRVPQSASPAVISLTTVRLVGRERPVLIDPIRRRVIEVYLQTDDIALTLLATQHDHFPGLPGLRLLLHPPGSEYAALATMFGAEILAVSRSALYHAADALMAHASRNALSRVDARLFQRRGAAIGRHARRRLDAWQRSTPNLHAAYEAKERFYAVWSGLADAGDVEARYDNWRRETDGLDRQAYALVLPLREIVDQSRAAVRAFYAERCGQYDLETASVVQQALARVGRKRNFQAARLAMLAASVSSNE